MASYITVKGRNISCRWLKHYLLEHPEVRPLPRARVPSPVRPARPKKKAAPAIYARFFLPAIDGTGEEPETRLIRINGDCRDQEWLQDMTTGYAQLGAGLTTFFPDLNR